MKKIFLSIAFIATGLVASAQVGVGTENPQTSLHIVGANATDKGSAGTNVPGALAATDGITVPVVTNDMTLAVPAQLVAGTKVSQMVYSTFTGKAGYYFWDGAKWNSMVPAAAAGPSFRYVAGTALVDILPSDIGNIVVVNSGVSGDIVFPVTNPSLAGKRVTIIESTGIVMNLTNQNTNYKTNTYSDIQKSGAEFITDGVNWYTLGGQ